MHIILSTLNLNLVLVYCYTDCHILAMYQCPIILHFRQLIFQSDTDYYKYNKSYNIVSKLANLFQLLGSIMSRMYKNYLMLIS